MKMMNFNPSLDMGAEISNYKTLRRISTKAMVLIVLQPSAGFVAAMLNLSLYSFSLLPTGFKMSHLILLSGKVLDLDLLVDLSSVSDFPLTGFRYVNVSLSRALATALLFCSFHFC